MNIYAIPDIHGEIGKLTEAVQKIRAHADGRPCRAIFLGDYIDRGRNSRTVVNLIRGLCLKNGVWRLLHYNIKWEAVLGNHEDLLLQATEQNTNKVSPELVLSYLFHHGDLKSHLEWLDSLPTMVQTENHAFVHAGCDPRHPLDAQPERALLWIRKWDEKEHDFGKHIVHGHTARKEPMLRKHSTGLDTGCGLGGALSVGVFDSEKREGPFEILTV